MNFHVFLTDDASRDLEELYDYIESRDVVGKADFVLDQIEKTFTNLFKNPERGAYPPELLAVGLREYRELGFFTNFAQLFCHSCLPASAGSFPAFDDIFRQTN